MMNNKVVWVPDSNELGKTSKQCMGSKNENNSKRGQSKKKLKLAKSRDIEVKRIC